MTGFPALTAQLTRNMDLECHKNIYDESGLYGRKELKFNRAELRYEPLLSFPTSWHGLYTHVFNFYEPTEHFIAGMILYQEELRMVNFSYENKFYLNVHQLNAEKNILFLGW
jgi:hypothetical protein